MGWVRTRVVMVVVVGALGFPGVASAQADYTQADSVERPELRRELLERVEKDQAVRKRLLEKGMVNPDRALIAEMRGIDSSNTARMKELVAEHGWPGPELVGEDGTNAAFLIVQHADAEFQKLVLPLVKKAYEAGALDGQSYALLLDRVLVQGGNDQIYGTQIKPMHLWEDGPEPYPIQDREDVDARRAKVGLPPLDAYMEVIRKMYQSERG